MSSKSLTFCGAVLLAVAVLVTSATPAQANWYRGYGGYYGGYGYGYGHHGYGYGYPGWGYGGYYHGGYSPYYGYSPGYYSYRPYYGYAYPSYGYASPYYSYSTPYYGYTYPYYGASYATPAYAGYATTGYAANTGVVAASYNQSAPTPAAAGTPASITVRVPENADIWIDNARMNNLGTVRRFQTGPIADGRTYTYEVRASWQGPDGPVTRTREVTVSAGSNAQADFMTAPAATGTNTAALP